MLELEKLDTNTYKLVCYVFNIAELEYWVNTTIVADTHKKNKCFSYIRLMVDAYKRGAGEKELDESFMARNIARLLSLKGMGAPIRKVE